MPPTLYKIEPSKNDDFGNGNNLLQENTVSKRNKLGNKRLEDE